MDKKPWVKPTLTKLDHLTREQLLPIIARGERKLRENQRQQLEGQPLTPRERDVLWLAAWGHSARGMGQILAIAHRTAENHLQTAFIKLGAGNRIEAIVRAVQLGEIDLKGVMRWHL